MRESETYLPSIDETARKRFEGARRQGDCSPLRQFLPDERDPRYLPTLEELVQIDLEWVWRQGDSRLAATTSPPIKYVEGFLEQFPRLNDVEILSRLLKQEYLVRHKFGDRPSAASYRVRFPELFHSDFDVESLWKQHVKRGEKTPQRFTAGKVIDRYRLIEPHATGGFGVVWRAEDERLGRPVALKHMKPSVLGNEELRQRFINEARITAVLEHPGIVPIHDIGGLEEECPYYTMKFVRGETFSDAIKAFHRSQAAREFDGRSIELLRLLNIFLNVARTVQYAHANRVIHRDLKPQNILIGDYGESILLDWGLARELKPMESEEIATVIASQLALLVSADPQKTRGGAVMGTPSYMSPEQASGRTTEVNEQSDVYGLGAILYEILTGKAPFEGRSSDEVLEKVKSADVAPPRLIQSQIERPLEAICLKAMAKKAEDRYLHVADLVADVEHWLADDRVQAHQESFAQRWSRWARRHRTWVRAAFALVLTTAMVSSVAAYMINESRNRAENLATRNNRLAKEAQASQRLAEAREAEAKEHYELARDAVDRYLNAITQDERLMAEALEPLRQRLLQFAAEFYEELAARNIDAELWPDMKLFTDQASAHVRLAWIDLELGQAIDALSESAIAIELLNQQRAAVPGHRPAILNLSEAYRIRGSSFEQIGQLLEADLEFSDSIALLREMMEAEPEDPVSIGQLVRVLQEQAALYALPTFPLVSVEGQLGDNEESPARDRLDEAELLLEEALALCERLSSMESIEMPTPWMNPRLIQADVLSARGYVYSLNGEHQAALETSLQALDMREDLLGENPEVDYLIAGIAAAHHNLGAVYVRMFEHQEGLQHNRLARNYYEKLAQRHPDVPQHLADVAVVTRNIAQGFRDLGDFDAALEEFHASSATFREIAEDFPQSFSYWEDWAETERMAAKIHLQQGEPEEALDSFDAAVTAYRHIIEVAPHLRLRLALCEVQSGIYHAHFEEHELALERLAAAEANYAILMEEDPDNIEFAVNRASALVNLGFLYNGSGESHRTEEALVTSIGILEEELVKHPDEEAVAQLLVKSHINLADIYAETGRPDDAERVFRDVLVHTNDWLMRWPEVIDLHADLAQCYAYVAEFSAANGRLEDALAARVEQEFVCSHLLSYAPGLESRLRLIGVIRDRIDLLYELDRFADCAERAEEGINLCEEFLNDEPGNQQLEEHLRELNARLSEALAEHQEESADECESSQQSGV